jgi:putative Mg2+ transporter-C (MgtC) family protein
MNIATDYFFGIHIDPLSLWGKTLVVMLAVLMGGIIGLERQWRGNAAGMRTHILVCVGSTVITLTSVEIGLGVRGGMRGDPGHIAAQIVSGIGFLGAGAILREGLNVKGLTTAASIWTTAGIGIALGASPRLGELAVVATVVTLATLVPLGWLEQRLKASQTTRTITVDVMQMDHCTGLVLEALVACDLEIISVVSQESKGQPGTSMPVRQMQIAVYSRLPFDSGKVSKSLTAVTGIVSFHIE